MDFYNDIDPYCCAWLDALMKEGLIPHGRIDNRSITDLRPADLRSYRRVHLFAGLGGWAEALRLANWPADLPVWTGSCPCQPFSVAGERRGTADVRHLWPYFHDLLVECGAPMVVGEQVASPDGLEWFAGVRADLEHAGRAVVAADYPAAGAGAPQIRQRLWWGAVWMADACGAGLSLPQYQELLRARWRQEGGAAQQPRRASRQLPVFRSSSGFAQGWVSDTDSGGLAQQSECDVRLGEQGRQSQGGRDALGLGIHGDAWGSDHWIEGPDKRWRRFEPSIRLVAAGVPQRVAKVRAGGNSICPQAGARFTAAFAQVCGVNLAH